MARGEEGKRQLISPAAESFPSGGAMQREREREILRPEKRSNDEIQVLDRRRWETIMSYIHNVEDKAKVYAGVDGWVVDTSNLLYG